MELEDERLIIHALDSHLESPSSRDQQLLCPNCLRRTVLVNSGWIRHVGTGMFDH